jgi:hypothetical protein
VVANQFVANLGQPPWIIMKQKFPFFKQYSWFWLVLYLIHGGYF